MNLGAHMSIAGGLPQAFLRGKEIGCSVIQLFVKNQVQWVGKPLGEEEIAEFKRLQEETGIATAFAHGTYLVNLASPVEGVWKRSVGATRDELERCEALGLPYLVLHPGSHKGEGLIFGIDRIARALDQLHADLPGYRVQVLLENTAGQGNVVGSRFEEIRAILDRVKASERLGVCLDTCHLFAAGYDIRTEEGYAGTMGAFHRAVGFDRLRAFHLNDAKRERGSGVDRHAHIGEGQIGLEAFRCLVNDVRFDGLPMLLETPKEDDMDRKNLAILRGLKRKAPIPITGAL